MIHKQFLTNKQLLGLVLLFLVGAVGLFLLKLIPARILIILFWVSGGVIGVALLLKITEWAVDSFIGIRAKFQPEENENGKQRTES